MGTAATARSGGVHGRSKALMLFEEMLSELPSKKRGELKQADVLLPVEVGLKAKTFSLLP